MSAYVYLFQGTVIGAANNDMGGLVAANGFVDGSPFFAEYLIDFDRPAMDRFQTGEVKVFSLETDFARADTYFATLLGGTQLRDATGWMPAYSPGDYAEFFEAANIHFFGPQASYGLITAGPYSAYISIFGDEVSPGNLLPWSVGEIAIAKSYARSAAGYSELWAEVTLVSVTPVPEPGASALFFGLIAWGCCFLRRRIRPKRLH